MPYAERDGVSLYYERDGSGDPELLFVPGWCCDHTFYAPQFEHFKRAHTLTALALRGCGHSSSPPDGYDIPSLADDVAWFCAEVGIERPVVVGHSLGGMIAIELGARHPSLPCALVAVDPGPVLGPVAHRACRDRRRGGVERRCRPDAVRPTAPRPGVGAGGGNDPARLQALRPATHFGMTVGAGHFHQLEVPEQVNAMIERFLAIAV